MAHTRRHASLTLAAYCALAVACFGTSSLRHPGTVYAGSSRDPEIFIWSFAWWPHAILHGFDPFVTKAIWTPDGVNLAWATSVPGLALLFAPLTLLAGPVAAYNVAVVLMPALAASTAFLLCRYLTQKTWPSLLGGYLFGFSSYVVGQEEAHLHASSVFLLPLVALAVLRFVRSELGGRGLVLRLGPLLALQLLFSTEVAFTLLLSLVVGGVLAAAVVPQARGRLRLLLVPLASSYTLAAALTAPFVYFLLTGFSSTTIHPPENFVSDLANLVVPTHLALVGGGWADGIVQRFSGNDAERGAFLGPAAIVVIVLYGIRRWRSPGARFLLLSLVVALVASFGAWLRIAGDKYVPMPWGLVERVPLLDNVLPTRLTVFSSLAAAVIVALWAASGGEVWPRVLLAMLAAAALLPDIGGHEWSTRYRLPAFFTSSVYKACLQHGDNVLPIPVTNDGDSMLWQARSGFRFSIAGGYIADLPPTSFMSPPAVAAIANNVIVSADRPDYVTQYVRLKHVTAIVVDGAVTPLWRPVFDRIATPHELSGVVLYHIGPDSLPPGCAPDG